MPLFSKLSRYNNLGLLIIRLGIGALMIFHGYPKLKGGPDLWHKIGSTMAVIGVHDFPTFWGFMAAFAETVGGLLFLIGFLFRPAALLLLITMVVAALHDYKAAGFGEASHAIALGTVFLAMFLIGPGRISVDKT